MGEEYRKAKKKGERECARAQSLGKSPYLASLAQTVANPDAHSLVPLGVMEIPLSLIAGTLTEGRKNAFSCGFMPVLDEGSEFAVKWEKLYEAQVTEGIRDPIRVVEYRHRFYVQEGNKLVSVLKYLESGKIAATVSRMLPSPEEEREAEQGGENYPEFLEFFRRSRLYDIVLSGPGAYAELEEIFREDGILPAKESAHVWTDEERRRVRSCYTTFEMSYLAIVKDNEQALPPGDAFLLYLKVFSPRSLLEGKREDIRRRIERLRKEYATRANDNGLRLLSAPEEEKKGWKLLSWLGRGVSYSAENPLRVAYLYEKEADESGWVYGHELGREAIDHLFSQLVVTRAYDSCADEAATRAALEDAAAAGCRTIFTTSPSMMPEAMRFAIRHPDIHVFNCSVNLKVNAVRTYYCRMYEVKFLTGALAAALSPTPEIGYVADYPIYGSIASINAFAIGAAMMRPDSKVRLMWDTQKGTDWRTFFESQGISIISGPDYIRPDSPLREYGLFERKDGQTIRLAAAMPDWARYYERMLLDEISSSGREGGTNDQAVGYWWGLPAGVIQLIFSPKLSPYTRRMMEVLLRDVTEGRLQPFSGELRSQTGPVCSEGLSCPEGTVQPDGMVRMKETLSAEEIITMDWLNENVIGELPAAWQFPDSARGTLKISGVKEEVRGDK